MSRCILRVVVTPRTPAALARAVEQFGSTNVSVLTRLVECVVAMDDESQAAIMRLLPQRHRIDVPERIIKAMAKSARSEQQVSPVVEKSPGE